MTRFLILDVFTEAPFGGNPLAVIPDATDVPEERLQRIAREFNFSETVFIYPPAEPGHTAALRIFTPMNEIPFAGHPTIGAAVVLASLGHGPDMVLDLCVGPIAATSYGTSATFTTPVPLSRKVKPLPADVARCLNLSVDAIETRTHPPEVVGVGLEFCMAELVSADALVACTPVIAAFRAAVAKYPGSLDFPILAYVRDGETVRARMFGPLDNIPEDPATGSAAAGLAAYLAELQGCDVTLNIQQGVEMGRPSYISARAAFEDGKVHSVTVSGQTVHVAEGRLTLP